MNTIANIQTKETDADRAYKAKQMEEIDRLSDLIERYGLDLIQLRNHNIDPDWYLNSIGYQYTGYRTGIRNMVNILSERFPNLKFGYFNPALTKKEKP
jgi:hypothetical protein